MQSQSKHVLGKDALAKRNFHEQDIAEVKQKYDQEMHPVSDFARVTECNVVATFLKTRVHL